MTPLPPQSVLPFLPVAPLINFISPESMYVVVLYILYRVDKYKYESFHLP